MKPPRDRQQIVVRPGDILSPGDIVANVDETNVITFCRRGNADTRAFCDMCQ